ncbi:MAG: hypothetical protein ACREDT_11590 [Methylocella sp.]
MENRTNHDHSTLDQQSLAQPGLTSEGAVPGDPSLRYTINHDENTLRLTQDGAVVVAAQRGQDGIFHEVETGTPIARDVGGSIVFDAATLASAAAPEEASHPSPW